MRFFADGPNLPDELLLARDEGQVVFFCGAGVSRARAGLPDFPALARAVIDDLGTTQNSPARLLLNWAERQERIDGVGSLTPTDRIFGLLEREFPVSEVRAAVARQLRPVEKPDLTAHKILLDLATAPGGAVKLVTTNFDLLFEAVNPLLNVRNPPFLLNSTTKDGFSGIIHLHGSVTDNYDGARGNEFVLSSADFGRAYLSEAWATSFIVRLLKEYKIVFVGYAADDPPVQYLLEALNTVQPGSGRLYAFQEGSHDAAIGLWAHKGVQAIAFDQGEQYAPLWQTLAAWATRARSPADWYETILTAAMGGPESLLPYQRGQVRHLVSTAAGMRRFALRSPPAEWMCVFDGQVRYKIPYKFQEADEQIDPFSLYGLDDDPAPVKDAAERAPRSVVPAGAWDIFELTNHDRSLTTYSQVGRFLGPTAQMASQLGDRLAYLGDWFGHVSTQPAAVWWAAGQVGLHPYVQSLIWRRVEADGMAPIIRKAWSYILHSWTENARDPDHVSFALAAQIKQLGWTRQRVRDWVIATQPRTKVDRSLRLGKPPKTDAQLKLNDMISVSFQFPRRYIEIEIPSHLLSLYVSEERRSFEIASDLQTEYYGFDAPRLPTLYRQKEDDTNTATVNDLGERVLTYASALENLGDFDRLSARQEVNSWLRGPVVYDRLRVWVSGNSKMTTGSEAALLLLSLDAAAFWSLDGQRDVLIAMAQRWSELPKVMRRRLERRILKGQPRRNTEITKKEHRRRQAHEILNRLFWLSQNGCSFSFDLETECAKYRLRAPDWREAFAHQAAVSRGIRSGYVRVDDSSRELETVPPLHLFEAASRFETREWGTFVERRPLAGIAKSHPIRLLRALILQAKNGHYPTGAWETFLNYDARKNDPRKLVRQVTRRLSWLHSTALAAIVYSASEWMLQFADVVRSDCEADFAALWRAIVSALRECPETTHPPTLQSDGIDWASHSLNSPAGKLAQVLMKTVRTSPPAAGLPPVWRARAEQILVLASDARRDVLVIFSFNLSWLLRRDPIWVNLNIIATLVEGDSEDRRAIWAGVFWSGQLANDEKLFSTLKPHLLFLFQDNVERHSYSSPIAFALLCAWRKSIEPKLAPLVSDGEMRSLLLESDENFRGGVLEHLSRLPPETPGLSSASALDFLRRVWPRQSLARSSVITEKLLEFSFYSATSQQRFEAAVDAILPFLTVISANSWILHRFQHLEECPDGHFTSGGLLKLLAVVLAEHPGDWPHGADALVERLATEPKVAGHPVLARLQAKLASRQ